MAVEDVAAARLAFERARSAASDGRCVVLDERFSLLAPFGPALLHHLGNPLARLRRHLAAPALARCAGSPAPAPTAATAARRPRRRRVRRASRPARSAPRALSRLRDLALDPAERPADELRRPDQHVVFLRGLPRGIVLLLSRPLSYVLMPPWQHGGYHTSRCRRPAVSRRCCSVAALLGARLPNGRRRPPRGLRARPTSPTTSSTTQAIDAAAAGRRARARRPREAPRAGERALAEHPVQARRGHGRSLSRIVSASASVDLQKPPADLDAEFRTHVDHAPSSWRKRASHARPRDAAGPLRSRAPRSASRRHISHRSKGGCSPASTPRAARYDEHEKVLELDPKRKDAGADRRHLPLHRLDAVAADADDGLRRRLRRRQGRGHPDDRGDRRRRRREPNRCAVRARPACTTGKGATTTPCG